MEDTPSQDLLIVMGDLIAMEQSTWAVRESWRGVARVFEINGERLVELCGMKNLRGNWRHSIPVKGHTQDPLEFSK